MIKPPIFVDPISKTELSFIAENNEFINSEKRAYPIIENIPRFVEPNNYATSFGLQWNKFSKTQLDSYTGTTISEDRLKRLCGGDLSVFKGKKVLEVGCGAGRFTEIMLAAGASVSAVDISSAVEANYQNCKNYPNYSVCQANVYNLPFNYEEFDIVVCIGVIQHTPDPEKTINTLCNYVKPSGTLIIDHYTKGYPETFFRKKIRNFLLKREIEYRFNYCKKLTKRLYPLHKFSWKLKIIPILSYLGRAFIYFSPVVDYHDIYPQLSDEQLYAWMFLDTHDTLTDHYKHTRSAEEIVSILEANSMEAIFTEYAGNGVEARCTKKV
ncbi:MAG: methyltransferase domain-containing protein [Bacteroidales bacterium]|nr:methyltransferase domain-containing protein [Bacteroidales bacterium]